MYMHFLRIPHIYSVSVLFLNFFRLFAVEIAITFDDHPMPAGNVFSSTERALHYCKAFEKYACKGAFFCIGSYCQNAQDPQCMDRLNNEGHFIANHSFNHKHLSALDLNDFVIEIVSAEAILSSYGQFRKWFRFPFLDYGNREDLGGSEEKFRTAIALLKQLGYQEGFVTINTFDWYINSLLQKAIQSNKKINYPQLKEAYLSLLNDWCKYYIDFYNNLFSDEITHTLLLHANDLNALFLEDVLEMIKKNGWTLASPERAFISPPWREEILKQPGLFLEKPPSLNYQAIEAELQSRCVFSNE